MSKVPATNNVPDVQQSFREVWTAIDPLLTQTVDLRGRYFVNAGDARGNKDLATLGQVVLEASKIAKDTVTKSQANGYDTIEDEGTKLAKRNILNFVGGGVAAADDISARTTVTVQTASASLEGTVSIGTQVFAGNKTFNGIVTFGDGTAGSKTVQFKNANTGIISWNPSGSRTLTLPDATDTLIGKATTDVLTNKTFDTAGAGNSFKVNSNAINNFSGSGATVILSSTPTIDAPLLTTSVQVGAGGTAITQVKVYTPSLTPASVNASTSAEQTFTVTGLTTADKVVVNGPAPTAGTGIVNARVSAADTLALTFMNATAGSLTPASGTYSIVAVRS